MTASLVVHDWVHGRKERDAWKIAALMLIPADVELLGRTSGEIAALCKVPVGLVERWRSL